MAEPTSTAATSSLTLLTAVSLLPGMQPEIILGAFAGAIVFVLSSNDIGPLKKLCFLAISFIAGLLGASSTSQLIASVLPARVTVSLGIGAMVCAAIAIKLLLWLISRASDPEALIARIKGGKP